MAETFLHGVQVVYVDNGSRPIATPASSVIGIVGTAPLADAAKFPLNTPVALTSLSESAGLVASTGGGAVGTLPARIAEIYKQAKPVVVMIRVEDGETEAATLANVIGGVDAATGQYKGVHAFLGAKSVVGVKPRILIAPGFTHQRPEDPENAGVKLKNPVVAELEGIATRMRAIVIQDGPSTTDAEALAVAEDSGHRRVYLIDPRATVVNASGAVEYVHASAAVAGVIARTDAERGWWASPSNSQISGIVGTERPIDFGLSDPTCRANLLNAQNVTTIVREDGFRLWGNRTLSGEFLCVVRTADMIADALETNHLWAVDRGITATYVEDVQEGVSAYLRDLKNLGAILGGNCWIDTELNSASNIKQGKFFWDFDFTPTYPGEQLTFRAHITDNYISEIFAK